MASTRRVILAARLCGIISLLMIGSSAPLLASCNLNGGWAGSFNDNSGNSFSLSVTFFNSTPSSFNATVTALFQNLGGEAFSASVSGPISGSSLSWQYVFPGEGTQSATASISADCSSINGTISTNYLSGNISTGLFRITPTGIGLSLGQVTFQSVPIGASSTPQSVMLTNTSSSTVPLGAPSVTPQFSASTTCGSSLSPNSSCSVDVACHPSSTGIQAGKLYITDPSKMPIGTAPLACVGVSQLLGATFVPENGWWWDSKLNGTGFFIEYGGASGKGLFVGGFLYDAAGNSTWLVSTGAITGTTYISAWLKVAGGQTLLGAYKPPTPPTPVAAVTISFTDATHAVMTRPGSPSINLERFSFSTAPPTPPVGGAPQNGWWWGGVLLSGTGYGIEIQGSSVFIVGYVYDNSGNPVWYLATGDMSAPNRYTGTWDIYGGGPQLTSVEGSYGAQKVPGTSVPMTLTFTDATDGTLTMGSVAIPIVRFQAY